MFHPRSRVGKQGNFERLDDEEKDDEEGHQSGHEQEIAFHLDETEPLNQ
jgi:hypothetical protein